MIDVHATKLIEVSCVVGSDVEGSRGEHGRENDVESAKRDDGFRW